MAQWTLLMLHAVIFIPVSLFMIWIPYLTRRSECFGVTVPDEAHRLPAVAALKKQYGWLCGAICFLLTGSILILTFRLEETALMHALTGHIIALVSLTFAVYLKQHYAMKRLKREAGWASAYSQQVVVDTGFHNRKLTYSNWWFLPHGLIIALTFGTGIWLYDRFPDQIVMQYQLDGQPGRIVDKTMAAVLWPGAVQIFILAVFIFTNLIIGLSKQQLEASDPQGSLGRNMLFRRKWSAYMIILGFVMVTMFYWSQISMLIQPDPQLLLLVPVVMVAVTVGGAMWLSFKTGQGGSKLQGSGAPSPAGASVPDHDRYWKLGQFYFNPNDPALFVEKRFGVGWTVNLARPAVWLIVAALIGIPVALSLLFSP